MPRLGAGGRSFPDLPLQLIAVSVDGGLASSDRVDRAPLPSIVIPGAARFGHAEGPAFFRLITRLCVQRPILSASNSLKLAREAKGLVSLALAAVARNESVFDNQEWTPPATDSRGSWPAVPDKLFE